MVWEPETPRGCGTAPAFLPSLYPSCGRGLPRPEPTGKSPLQYPEMVELDRYGHSRKTCEGGGGGRITSNVTRVDDRNLRH